MSKEPTAKTPGERVVSSVGAPSAEELERLVSPVAVPGRFFSDIGPGSQGFVLWLTGLSGAGKTTIADALSAELGLRGHLVELLDGDVVRTHLSKGLGFSKEDRDENVRRVGWVASRVARAGASVIASLISPYPETRQEAQTMAESVGAIFFEVHVAAPLDVCIERDVKGLYAKALAGEISGFTGIDDPYIAPEHPDLRLDTSVLTVEESLDELLRLLASRNCLRLA